MNYPKVYLFNKKEDKYEIYFGGFSTLDGLQLFDENLNINIEEFGATNYKDFGFATENDIPKIQTVGEFISFLENVDFIDLIHCKIELTGIGNLSTHDDAECHFILDTEKMAFELIKKAALYKEKILSELIQHPNNYITIDHEGNVQRFYTFQEYIKSNN